MATRFGGVKYANSEVKNLPKENKMDLNITKWYVRLFLWSLEIWDKFWHGWDTSYQYEQGTNLCHFARVICVWAPLVIALHAALYLGVVFTLVVLPLHYFGEVGGIGHLTAMETLGLIVLALTVIILAVVILNAWYSKQVKKRPRSRAPRVEKEKKPREPGIWQIIGVWLMARKHKMCPIITFYNPSEVTKDA